MLDPADAMDEPQGIDLRHEHFRGEALGSAKLHQALLDFADFTGATLAQADLSSGRLRFAALSGADLESVDLFGADLRHARLDHADLRTAKLNDAQLDYADFAGANLANADLRGQCLGFARLTGANLSAADLAGADLRHACLKSADLNGADLRGALLDYANLDGANLAEADLRGASLRYAKNVEPARIDRSVIDETTVLPFWFEEPLGGLKTRRRRFPNIRRASIVSACVLGACALLGLGALTLDRTVPGTSGIATTPAVAASVHGDVTVALPTAPKVPPAVTKASMLGPRLLNESWASGQQVVRWRDLSASGAVATKGEVPISGPHLPSKPPMRLAALVLPESGRQDVTPVSVDINVSPAITSDAVEGSALVLSPALDWPTSRMNGVSPDSAVDAVSALPVLAALEGPADALVSRPDPAIEIIATLPKLEPLTVIVSLNRQTLDVYRGTELIDSAKVSSGKRGHETRTGVYSILQKRRDHRSNLYNGAPMPWMQRLTRTGTALHGGAIPGYPASHGCVRLPHGFAPQLFEMTSVGENVVVAADRVVPKVIEHSLLSKLSMQPGPDQVVSASFSDPVINLKRGAPLRILVTRRTERDRAIDVQYLLASMGHLRPQNFTGRVGTETIAAIKAFEKANGLVETGTFNGALVSQVYDAAEKEEPPEGRLFIRQQFNRVLDVPVAFHDPNRQLGTHLFSVVKQDPESGALRWTAITLEGDQPARVLDRIAIPDDVRQAIADFVTPGSSLIVADKSINAAVLPEGDDFLVWAKHSPKAAPPKATVKKKPAVKRRTTRKPTSKRQAATSRKRTVKRQAVPRPTPRRWLFSRW